MSNNELTPEERDLLNKLLAKAGKKPLTPPKTGEFGEDVEVSDLTDTQDPIPDRGSELQQKTVHMVCRVKAPMGGTRRKCPGTQATIIRSVNKSLNFGAGELAGGGKITTYRCLTCNGVFTIST